MMMPKRTKYRKQMKGKNRGLASRGYAISFGEFGLKAMTRGQISSKQLESARKTITGVTKRAGKMWVLVFPDKPITKKPLEVRMGKGKGAVDHYAINIKPGKMLFELSGIEESIAREAFTKAASKLPVRTKFISETPVAAA